MEQVKIVLMALVMAMNAMGATTPNPAWRSQISGLVKERNPTNRMEALASLSIQPTNAVMSNEVWRLVALTRQELDQAALANAAIAKLSQPGISNKTVAEVLFLRGQPAVACGVLTNVLMDTNMTDIARMRAAESVCNLLVGNWRKSRLENLRRQRGEEIVVRVVTYALTHVRIVDGNYREAERLLDIFLEIMADGNADQATIHRLLRGMLAHLTLSPATEKLNGRILMLLERQNGFIGAGGTNNFSWVGTNWWIGLTGSAAMAMRWKEAISVPAPLPGNVYSAALRAEKNNLAAQEAWATRYRSVAEKR